MSKYTIYPGKEVDYKSKRGIKYVLVNVNGELICRKNGKKCKPTKEILEKFTVSGGKYLVYSDGGCVCNPGGAGGYGAVVVDGNGTITQLSEGFISTTNNRMEMRGAIAGIGFVPRGSEIEFFSDSQYVINTMTGFYSRKKNLDLWEELDKVCKGKKIKFLWVKGHAGNDLNEVCDRLATAAMTGTDLKKDKGYDGPKRAAPAATTTSSMTVKIDADETRPKRGEITPICQACLNTFYSKKDHKFKDYAAIKAGGFDIYSTMSARELLDICDADVKVLRKYLREVNVVKALRWYCRGLSLADSIRKVLVDEEIQQNCIGRKK